MDTDDDTPGRDPHSRAIRDARALEGRLRAEKRFVDAFIIAKLCRSSEASKRLNRRLSNDLKEALGNR